MKPFAVCSTWFSDESAINRVFGEVIWKLDEQFHRFLENPRTLRNTKRKFIFYRYKREKKLFSIDFVKKFLVNN